MNSRGPESIEDELHRLTRQIHQRDLLGTIAYTLGLLTILALMFLPFDLSRVGGVVLIVALAYMISRLHTLGQRDPRPGGDDAYDYLRQQLLTLNAQIELGQSAFYHLPFVVGANLFWMGLPYTENPETKALLDCLFLAATVLAFSASFLANQRLLQKQFIPLQRELELAEEEQEQTEQF